jgi:hypothetical protein
MKRQKSCGPRLGKLVHQLPGVVTFAYDLRFRRMIACWKGIAEEIQFGGSIMREIKLWNPKTIEYARHATKLIEQKNKFNRPSFTSLDRSNKYSNERSKKYSTDKSNKYVPPHLREGERAKQYPDKKWENKCRYCGDKWSASA